MIQITQIGLCFEVREASWPCRAARPLWVETPSPGHRTVVNCLLQVCRPLAVVDRLGKDKKAVVKNPYPTIRGERRCWEPWLGAELG